MRQMPVPHRPHNPCLWLTKWPLHFLWSLVFGLWSLVFSLWPLASGLFGPQERILVIRRRHQRLLDAPGARPPHQVPLRARLVIGAGRPRAAERLLTHHRPGGLVVD